MREMCQKLYMKHFFLGKNVNTYNCFIYFSLLLWVLL